MQIYHFTCLANKIRLDKFLVEQFLTIDNTITRSKIQQLIKGSKVIIDGIIISDCNHLVKQNQQIDITIANTQTQHLQATKIDFSIVYQDDDLLVINKPAGLTVHPGAGNQQNTLVNGLLFLQQQLSSEQLSSEGNRPGIVHRLDKDTSGLMLVAKNDFTHLKLSQMLKDRLVHRVYLAFIYGVMQPQQGIINKNICRSSRNRLKMITCKQTGRVAISNYKTLQIFGNKFASLVECKLETGRTHQIRVHFESEKHSLIGDQLYNSCKKLLPKNYSQDLIDHLNLLNRQALHSSFLQFEHPRSKQILEFSCELPTELKQLQDLLLQLNLQQF